ncbi:hypothetical protein ACQJBY_067735 [Aegilops geniculata]
MPARAQTPLPHELLLDAPLSSSLLSSARRLVVELVRAGDDMAAAKQQPPLYIAVADDRQRSSFPCTRPILQSALQLMGCKPRHTFKVCLPPSCLSPNLSAHFFSPGFSLNL